MKWREQRGGRSERGFALLTAIVFLVLVLALGGGLIQQAMQEVNTAGRAKKETRAFNLAEAGVDYAAWQLYNHPTTVLPTTWTRSDLEGGSFSVTASNYNGVSGLIQVLSAGTSQADTAQVKVIGQFLPTGPSGQNAVFNYGVFSNSDVTMNGNFKVTGNGHGNGNFTMNGNATIDGNLSAVGKIKLTGLAKVTGTKTAGAARVGMPVIDLQHYRDIATAVYAGGKSFNGNFSLNGVTYVDGDASFNGNFSGTGTIVVKGKATINGNARVSGAGDAFAIVSAGGVKINGNCIIDGWIYTHNVDVPGQFQGNGNATITGGVAADVISVNGNMTINYKPVAVDMPGATTAPAQFDGVSWHRVR